MPLASRVYNSWPPASCLWFSPHHNHLSLANSQHFSLRLAGWHGWLAAASISPPCQLWAMLMLDAWLSPTQSAAACLCLPTHSASASLESQIRGPVLPFSLQSLTHHVRQLTKKQMTNFTGLDPVGKRQVLQQWRRENVEEFSLYIYFEHHSLNSKGKNCVDKSHNLILKEMLLPIAPWKTWTPQMAQCLILLEENIPSRQLIGLKKVTTLKQIQEIWQLQVKLTNLLGKQLSKRTQRLVSDQC